ncbi:hypothetical protein [Sulfuricurvum sp.]|uniref:hypothetical protein n=1 Tax=Sulfuricurvum sp. TaxID=2025608 RepID=UPI0026139D3A|nr:hypothetical protein [Sulfuricurvum sp.]MDD4950856.1 hypothetical protein [Sulfuricurvum sp.]
MSEIVKLIFERFEGFIKRAVLPSVTFLFFYIVLYMFFGSLYDTAMTSVEVFPKFPKDMELYGYGILFIGLSYFLSILQQAVFDNFIKGNYSIAQDFQDLRNKVKKKLREEKDIPDENDAFLTDYILYQILGKSQKTERYVDETKAIGITILSLMINCILTGILLHEAFSYWAFCFLALSILFLRLGIYLIKKKYESRAIRLYVNYLYS